MSIATKLQKILDSKAAIKAAIAGKGGTITDATPLDEYATAIDNLPSGSNEDLIKVIDGTVTTLTIPSGTTNIKPYTFYQCKQLTDVTIPDSVTALGNNSFYFCNRLENVDWGTGITAIGNQAFFACSVLKTVNLSSNMRTLGNQAFGACYELQTVTIEEGLETIGSNAFQSCDRRLTSIHFPNSVTTIGANVLNGCGNLTDIVIGSGITAIGNSFFSGNNSVTIRIYATTPPTLGTNFVPATFSGKIYVPDASVNDYKTATNWSTYAAYIYPLSDYQP